MIITLFLFSLGLILVIKGGDWFVDSSIKTANIFKLPKVFIGATIVSIATTLPELIVSVTASIQKQSTMAFGNGLGSFICNIGLILSFNGLLSNIRCKGKEYSYKICILTLSLLILLIFSINFTITKFESIFLLLAFISYIIYNIKIISYKKSKTTNNHVFKKKYISITIRFVLGIIFIIIGSNLLIKKGTLLAEYLNVPTSIISLTIIALGTSLPELITCIASVIKKNFEIGIGNIIGANILNIFMVIGSSATINDITILPRNIYFDIPVALLITIILLIPSLKTKKISKLQSFISLCIYLLYIYLCWKSNL